MNKHFFSHKHALHCVPVLCLCSCAFLISHMPKRNLNAPHCQTHSQQLVLCFVLALHQQSCTVGQRKTDDWVLVWKHYIVGRQVVWTSSVSALLIHLSCLHALNKCYVNAWIQSLGLDLNFFICALLQTPLKGPMAVFLMKSRDNPVKAIGMVTVIVSTLVGVTVLISTAMYMRNLKSNRIMPVRRVIKRRPRDQQPWTFKMPVIKFNNPADKFLIDDPENSPPRDTSSHRPKPQPPNAPCLPPPPPSNSRPCERPRAVPTISGALASKGSKKAKSSRRKEGNISSALVSELKMKLEQKIIESNQGYY